MQPLGELSRLGGWAHPRATDQGGSAEGMSKNENMQWQVVLTRSTVLETNGLGSCPSSMARLERRMLDRSGDDVSTVEC